jgi:hypothetical protein
VERSPEPLGRFLHAWLVGAEATVKDHYQQSASWTSVRQVIQAPTIGERSVRDVPAREIVHVIDAVIFRWPHICGGSRRRRTEGVDESRLHHVGCGMWLSKTCRLGGLCEAVYICISIPSRCCFLLRRGVAENAVDACSYSQSSTAHLTNTPLANARELGRPTHGG